MMWYPWNFNAFERELPTLDLFRQLDRALRAPSPVAREAEPTTALYETDSGYVFSVDLPGASEQELTLDVHEQTLTLEAKRALPAREGYAAQRAERAAFAWKRSYTFPTRLDSERTRARFEDGVLIVEIAKAPEAQARRVAISVV